VRRAAASAPVLSDDMPFLRSVALLGGPQPRTPGKWPGRTAV